MQMHRAMENRKPGTAVNEIATAARMAAVGSRNFRNIIII